MRIPRPPLARSFQPRSSHLGRSPRLERRALLCEFRKDRFFSVLFAFSAVKYPAPIRVSSVAKTAWLRPLTTIEIRAESP